MFRARAEDPQERLRVDPVACDGVGICSHLAPRLVTVDTWGYPIVPAEPLTRRARRSAALAVAGCPRKALFLEPASAPPATAPPATAPPPTAPPQPRRRASRRLRRPVRCRHPLRRPRHRRSRPLDRPGRAAVVVDGHRGAVGLELDLGLFARPALGLVRPCSPGPGSRRPGRPDRIRDPSRWCSGRRPTAAGRRQHPGDRRRAAARWCATSTTSPSRPAAGAWSSRCRPRRSAPVPRADGVGAVDEGRAAGRPSRWSWSWARWPTSRCCSRRAGRWRWARGAGPRRTGCEPGTGSAGRPGCRRRWPAGRAPACRRSRRRPTRGRHTQPRTYRDPPPSTILGGLDERRG